MSVLAKVGVNFGLKVHLAEEVIQPSMLIEGKQMGLSASEEVEQVGLSASEEVEVLLDAPCLGCSISASNWWRR